MDHTTAHTPARALRFTRGIKRGFTLVELLVVIAVVAILIGVLLPAIAGAREAGYRSVSASNLRQVAIMMNVYANDYDTEFPVVTPWLQGMPEGSSQKSNKHIAPGSLFGGQGYYGGFAGFFTIDQRNHADGAYHYKDDRLAVWNMSDRAWTNKKYDDPADASPPLKRYVENWSDLQMLQNPADQLDGGENGTKTPAVTPEKIIEEGDVVWHNISYMYVAGLNQRTPQLGFLGDETNHVDWGNGFGLSKFGIDGGGSFHGTLRKGAEAPFKPGYSDKDNHGDEGGNYVYTDGHAEWIAQSTGLKIDGDPYKLGFDPHDRIFSEINRFLSKGTGSVMTVD